MGKTGLIYKHTNLKNGRVYIGSTTIPVNRRWCKNRKEYNSYKSCTVFHRALVKYGWEGFKSEIIEDNIPQEELLKKEEYYINKYNSLTPNGYNSVGILDGKNFYSEETKQKISNSRKEYYKSLDTPIIAPNRLDHREINGIKHKYCKECECEKPLSEFHKLTSSWDGLARRCKPCANKIRFAHHDKNRPSEEQKLATRLKTIESNRAKISESLKKMYEENPEKRKKISQNLKRKVYAKNPVTGDVIIFESGLEAKEKGFHSPNIDKAIRLNGLYKGLKWSRIPFPESN